MPNDLTIQQLLARLEGGDLTQRSAALRQLRGQQNALITPQVLPLLHDQNAVIRLLAAEVLGKNGDETAARPLIDTLYDPEAHVRAAAADALGQLRSQSAVKPLIDLLYDESVIVRFAAAAALALIADPRAVIDLIHMLDNDDAPVAMMAAHALLNIGTPEALAAIQHLRDNEGNYHFGTPDTAAIQEETLRNIPLDLLRQYLDSQDAAEQPSRVREVEETPSSSENVPSHPPSQVPDAKDAEAPPEPVQFSAYFPREVPPGDWQPMRAYVFKPSAAAAVAADAGRELGSLDAFREVVRPSHSAVTPGALITATPHLPGFQFNPPTAQAAFYEDWQRFNFRLRAVDAPLDTAGNGHIRFTIEGVIVAEIPLAIFVGSSAAAADTRETDLVTRPIYQSIFCSYSHRDAQIVERVERAYRALGMTFLRDVVTLRSGQDWSDELLRLIDQADIFQLFWSSAAAQSEAVRKEWRHALKKQQRGAFIRPVFWEQPLPPPPPELSSIHFAYAPDLDTP